MQALTDCTDPEKEASMKTELTKKYYVNPDYSEKIKQTFANLGSKMKQLKFSLSSRKKKTHHRNGSGSTDNLSSEGRDSNEIESNDGKELRASDTELIKSNTQPLPIQKIPMHKSVDTGLEMAKFPVKKTIPTKTVLKKSPEKNVKGERLVAKANPERISHINSPPKKMFKKETTKTPVKKMPFKGPNPGPNKIGPKKVVKAVPLKSPSPRTVKAKAMWDFEAQNEKELAFSAGEIINIIDNSHEDWWKGELQGRTGWFPKDFVSLL